MVRDSIGVIYLKIITEKGGVKARSVNDRSIEHSISQKTELSKKNEKALSGKTERTVRRSEKDEPMPHHSGSNSGSLSNARNTPAAKLLTVKSRFQNLQQQLAVQEPKLKLPVLLRK